MGDGTAFGMSCRARNRGAAATGAGWAAGGADAYVTADLRHHPASEHLAGGGPALIDAPHWATERPWLDDVAGAVRDHTGLAVTVSDLVTDPWTSHVPSVLTAKEPRL
jgi:putative NIF3 family GTP cyclohydrolase 1 type 2